jgi:hypothetical protein
MVKRRIAIEAVAEPLRSTNKPSHAGPKATEATAVFPGVGRIARFVVAARLGLNRLDLFCGALEIEHIPFGPGH